MAWTSPKLPDLECALASLEPPADSPVPICSGGNPRGFCRPSCGVVLEPMGVARRSCGGIGRPSVGTASLAPFTTGLALGDAGMERPRRGVRLPLWARPPGMGGRRRGAGDDMAGCGLGDDALLRGCIYSISTRKGTATAHSSMMQSPALAVRALVCGAPSDELYGAASD